MEETATKPVPTIGRIVLVRRPNSAKGDDDAISPAILTKVHEDDADTISVCAFGSGGVTTYSRCVYGDVESTRKSEHVRWAWMPYQIEKAKAQELGQSPPPAVVQ